MFSRKSRQELNEAVARVPSSRRAPSPAGGAGGSWSEMAVETGHTTGPDRPGRTLDPEHKTSCACDCQSYAPVVARRYADDHIRYPDWFGKGGTDIKVEILSAHCQSVADGPPCTWVATLEAVDENGDKLTIVVMLYGESMFYVWTDKNYPIGCYGFRCAGPGESGMTLFPVQCPGRKTG